MSRGSSQLSACLLSALPTLLLAVQVHHEVTCRKTHLIHIGKTGGTTIRAFHEALSEEEQERLVIHKNHHFLLGHGGPEDCYAFFVRDPVERWVSGFLENLEEFWKDADPTEEEKFALRTFKTPTELAEALESTDEAQRAEALRANDALEHTRNTFAFFLPNLTEYLPQILFVGETRNLQHDFEALCRKVGFAPPNLTDAGHHRHNICPDEMEWMKAISPKADESLRHLLHEDYKIMDALKAAGLIRSADVRRLRCVATQRRCMVATPDGHFRMVSNALSAGKLDIYALPNATSPENLLAASPK